MRLHAEERLTFHWPVVFALGFFAVVAQALLFRAFLTVYEGNELGISCFFSSWLLWVGAGALAARLIPATLSCRLLRYFTFLPLVYLPAYAGQLLLIQQSRALAGIESYELFPFARMLPVSFLANAPVSFCTGLLFTLAVKWLSESKPLAVAWVYIWEAAGSCAGGVAATLLLWAGRSPETTMFCAALVVAGAGAAHGWVRRARLTGAVPLLLVVGAIGLGVPGHWARVNDLHAWCRLFPADAYDGSFATPQAYYHFGRHQGQFNVVAWESVVESVPGTEPASEVIAIHLAQKPDARRFLVIGSGSYGICRRLASLPQVERITWLTPDPAYPQKLMEVLPLEFQQGTGAVDIPGVDPRTFLRQSPEPYDLVIVNLPDAATLSLNRYCTREFFELLKQRMSRDGVVGIRVSAGENYMGAELVNLGASVLHTLKAVFKDVALKPGDDTWMIASDSGRLSMFSLELRARYRQVKGAEQVYPADGLISLYSPERIDDLLARYRQAETAAVGNSLLNTDREPKALLHALLLVARQTAAPETMFAMVATAGAVGFLVLVAAAVLYVLLRAVYLCRSVSRWPSAPEPGQGDGSSSVAFDSHFAVVSSGAAAMGTTLVFMFAYQSRFGSVFLHIGLISAVFMLGLTAGSLAAARSLSTGKWRPQAILAFVIAVHVAFLAVVALLPSAGVGVAPLFLCFLVCGLLSGAYVPVAAARLETCGVGDATAGSLIELNDHVGGALGGLLTGLFLLPVLGVPSALAVQALMIGANLASLLPYRWLAAHLSPRWQAEGTAVAPDRFDRVARATGYVFFGAAAILLLVAQLHARLTKVDGRQLLAQAASTMTGGATLVEATAPLENRQAMYYFRQDAEPGIVRAYVFGTEALASDVRGYGGPLALAVATDKDGVLRDVRILHSNETPAYLRRLDSWMHNLLGRNVFRDEPFKGVDAVSGATVTSAALMRTVAIAGQGFAAHVLGQGSTVPVSESHWRMPDRTVTLLGALAAVAVMLRWARLARFRRGWLLLILLVAGTSLNAQYSLEHVASLALLRAGGHSVSVGVAMAVGIPILVILFGNVYCGYLCPFGALQELVGDLRPLRLAIIPSKAVWRYARMVKYVLLFAAVCLLALPPASDVPSLDPLVTVFGRAPAMPIVWITLLAVCLAFFVPRFWCRTFCVGGAFLGLLGGLHLLRRFTPGISPDACSYGVRNRDELDCIRCDRCRRIEPREAHALQAAETAPGWRWADSVFLAIIGGAFLGCAHLSAPGWRTVLQRPPNSVESGAGTARMRTVNTPKLKALLDAGKLSSREALYYRKADNPLPRQPTPGEPPKKPPQP